MKNLISSIYSPPRKKHNKTLKEYYGADCQVSYFSLARHALKNGLISLNLSPGSRALIPSFICRDVLAPFNELGLEILFYDVDENLNLIGKPEDLPKAELILAIHYFGLETNLKPYQKYCELHNAFLIEDNAHGLFSRNSERQLLGTSGDVGIVSVRKTLPIQNGAILLQKKKISSSNLQLEMIIQESFRLNLKNVLRPFVAQLGISFLLWGTRLKRKMRKLIKGTEVPLSTDEDEFQIPFVPNPTDIDGYFLTVDIENEILRRRELFKTLKEILNKSAIRPYRNSLGANEVPYGFPFFCSSEEIHAVKTKLESLNLEIVNWPALPTCIVSKGAPEFYFNLYLVKFLW